MGFIDYPSSPILCCDVWNVDLGRPSASQKGEFQELVGFSSPFTKLYCQLVNPKILKIGRPKFTMDLSNVRVWIPGIGWTGKAEEILELTRELHKVKQEDWQRLAEELEVIPSKERSHIPPWENDFFFWKVLLGRDMWIVPRRVFIPLLVEMNQIQFLLNPKELQSDLATARSEDSRDCPGDRSPGNFGQKARDEVRHFGQNMMEKWAGTFSSNMQVGEIWWQYKSKFTNKLINSFLYVYLPNKHAVPTLKNKLYTL